MAEVSLERPVPRWAIVGAGVMIALSITAAATAKWTGVGAMRTPEPVAVGALDFVVRDRGDGAVEVLHRGGSLVLGAGDHGFVRGILRGLARDRKLRGIGWEMPFRLVRRDDGGLVLQDPATGSALDLRAYGADNAEAFAVLAGGD